jgi:hypothetical protein
MSKGFNRVLHGGHWRCSKGYKAVCRVSFRYLASSHLCNSYTMSFRLCVGGIK